MPDPISEAGDSTGGKPFNVDARDAARAAPQAPAPTVIPGVPQTDSGQPSPTVLSAFGLNVPPGTPPANQPPPAAPVDPMFKANGVDAPAAPVVTTPPAVDPTHVDTAAQQVVENYSATIQRHAEQAYATALYNAKQDPSVIDAMLTSGDQTEMQIAEKLLARNPDLFGAGTVEEYQAKRTLEEAGADPRDKEIAQLKINQAKIDQREADREWKDWKKDNGLKDDSFGQLCDQVRKQNPNLPQGDIVAIARGRAGIKPLDPSPLDAVRVNAGGARGTPPEGQQMDPGALSVLGLGANEVQSADAYFEAIGSFKGR